MRELFEIFRVFFKIGALTFGGGYTMLPLLQADIVRNRKWTSEEEIIDYYAMSQSLPGIVAVNTAMLIGYKRKGAGGLLAACLGMVTPSIIIILVIALFIKNFLGHAAVIHAFNGVRIAVAALITKTVFDMGLKSLIDAACLGIFAVSLLVFSFADISPIIPVLAGAAAGIALMRRRAAA
ncbi:MAG: chromate transporter [Synergistaceae bacterium]|jgi:chromate transporter|nr:chromate transporter [Synergistaceae bacterium]